MTFCVGCRYSCSNNDFASLIVNSQEHHQTFGSKFVWILIRNLPKLKQRLRRKLVWVSVCFMIIDYLDKLSGGVPGGPGPLEIISTQMAGDINHFANKK